MEEDSENNQINRIVRLFKRLKKGHNEINKQMKVQAGILREIDSEIREIRSQSGQKRKRNHTSTNGKEIHEHEPAEKKRKLDQQSPKKREAKKKLKTTKNASNGKPQTLPLMTPPDVIDLTLEADSLPDDNYDVFFNQFDDEEEKENVGDEKEPKEAFVKHKEVIRNKKERENLVGVACEECQRFYDAHNISDRTVNKCSRHRHRKGNSPPPRERCTPPGYWDMSFMDNTPVKVRE